MNKIALLSILVCLSPCLQLRAENEGVPQKTAPGGERTPPRRFSGGTQAEGEYVDRWLTSLKERSPEEFERAKKMRQENPEEFRRHLHWKVEEMRMKGGQPGGSLREHPAVVEALKNLSPEDREWAMQRLQQPGPMAGRFGDMPMRGDALLDFKHQYSPEMQRAEERTRELAGKYRKAATDDERAEAKRELRVNLAQLFDQREKARAESLKQMEEKFAKLRQQIEERAKDREKIIDSYLEEKLRGDAPPK